MGQRIAPDIALCFSFEPPLNAPCAAATTDANYVSVPRFLLRAEYGQPSHLKFGHSMTELLLSVENHMAPQRDTRRASRSFRLLRSTTSRNPCKRECSPSLNKAPCIDPRHHAHSSFCIPRGDARTPTKSNRYYDAMVSFHLDETGSGSSQDAWR